MGTQVHKTGETTGACNIHINQESSKRRTALYLTRLDRSRGDATQGVSLGTWCLSKDELHDLKNVSGTVLDCSERDRKADLKANCVVASAFEHLIPVLGHACNSVLGTNHNTQFWRVVCGYWFRQYLDNLYDRFQTLLAARSKIGDATVLLIPRDQEWVADDTDDYSVAIFSDRLNHQLYGQIIRSCNLFNIEENPDIASDEIERIGRRSSSARLRYVVSLFSCLCGKFNRVVFLRSYFAAPLLMRLSFRFFSIPLLGTPRISGKWLIDRALRDKLAIELTKETNNFAVSDFERLALELIPRNLPRVFLENFFTLYRLASWLRPYRARLFLTANAFSAQEIYKVWVGCALEEKTGLHVILQHGGNYGHSEVMSDEEFEIGSCSAYLTTGWNAPGSTHVRPFTPSILSGLGDFQRHLPVSHAKGDLVWVLASLPRYHYTQWSAPQGAAFATYLDEQVSFLNGVSGDVRKDILCRNYHYDYGWSDLEYLKRNCGPFRIDIKRKPLRRVIRESRLMIFTYDSTSMMESMVLNVPTICFWNPEMWQWRNQAEPLLRKLKEVGIYHESADAAAEFINCKLTEGKLELWWSSLAVQNARKEYCGQYANVSGCEYKQWSEQISWWLKKVRVFRQIYG